MLSFYRAFKIMRERGTLKCDRNCKNWIGIAFVLGVFCRELWSCGVEDVAKERSIALV